MHVLVGITCKNAEITIGHVLKSICKLNYSFDKLHVLIVDAESTDRTVAIARDVLESHTVSYTIIVKKCSIPEGRNIILDYAVRHDFDIVLFVDADVVIYNKGLLQLLEKLLEKYGESVYCFHVERKKFTTEEELNLFAEHVVRTTTVCNLLNIKCVPWCGMGLTAISREIAKKVRFDHALTFAEDRKFGLDVWLSGHKVLYVRCEHPFGYDIDLMRTTSLYSKMCIRDYLRGVKNKAKALAYTHYRDSVLKSIVNFLRRREGRKFAYHSLCTLALCVSTIFLAIKLYIYALCSATLYGIMSGLYILKQLKEGERINKAMKNLVKQQLFSLPATVLTLLHFLSQSRTFEQVYRNIEICNRELGCTTL